MYMNIGIDIDEVLAKFIDTWHDFLNEEYSVKYKFDDIYSYSIPEVYDFSKEDAVKRIFDFYNSKNFSTIEPYENSKEVLSELKGDHKLIIVTSRPTEIEKQTINWLDKHYKDLFDDIILTSGFSRKGFCQTGNNKADICHEYDIDLFIEDAPAYCTGIAEEGIQVLMMDKPWNQDVKTGKKLKRIDNWNNVKEYIYEV